MLKSINKIIKYPRLTLKYPKEPLDSRFFIGKPQIDLAKCNLCGKCIEACPSRAININTETNNIGINLDECIFCAECEDVCECNAIQMTHEFELAAKNRSVLRNTPIIVEERDILDKSYKVIGSEVKKKISKIYKRSIQIREIDAGSCNGCDYEINGLNNPFNDIERFGIRFVPSPRHADMLLVTGTATRNMELALVKTYNATPDPKIVIAVGACACSGGIFRDNYATRNGIDCIVPVDVYVPGCPPRPQAILYAILMAIDKL